MSKNYIEIGGRTFELSHDINFTNHVNSNNYHYPSLYNVYNNPSSTKVRIYEDWFTWFDLLKSAEPWQYKETFGVRSYNTNFFTLGITVFVNNVWYYLEIFPTRNIANKLCGAY